MLKTVALLAAVSTFVFACTAAPADDTASSEGAATAAPSIESVFAGVKLGEPVCYVKSYNAAHMSGHPKQTVTDIRVELSYGDENSSFEAANGAKVTFQQKGTGAKIRELSCALVAAQVLCTEEVTCASSITLAPKPGGLRLINQNLRASGACDDGTGKPLSSASGADDVFDLVPVACHDGALANPPTVDCSQALMTQRACIDVMSDQKCDNMISKGTRWADEFQLSAADGKRLESAEECIQRFTDIATADGCCGG